MLQGLIAETSLPALFSQAGIEGDPMNEWIQSIASGLNTLLKRKTQAQAVTATVPQGHSSGLASPSPANGSTELAVAIATEVKEDDSDKEANPNKKTKTRDTDEEMDKELYEVKVAPKATSAMKLM